MKIAVWDTYVTKKDGTLMHFDILVPDDMNDTKLIFEHGQNYLAQKGQKGQALTSKECSLCHIEEATPEIKQSIEARGYSIIEMEGCN
ncbi:hypothetical protein ACM46_08745 [Chryseobacterium angstadtii]|uniref:DUF2024 domain-containing protein n=2 Tax=Chryseobacterium angstadtii TaxID=558151 RepID=A0A0J7IGQ6_9FLAO|nr:DUF2024 family protein [Chryseobacterium angstadtii]KMQ65171.1 hypothetical protein ACM46_08745 [Chryseobacterium angstadtii]